MARPDRVRRVFFVAGEVSGDLHGAEVARHLRAAGAGLRLEGIGGQRMAAAGVTLLEDSSDWGIMGWLDAARQIRRFARRLDALCARLLADPPDVVVPIDFSGFNVALLRRLRGRVRAVYYVPPMVSVRRGNRARRIAALGCRLLAIFPFEAEAYRAAGADVVFVGHPAVDLASEGGSEAGARTRLGLPPEAPVLGLLPGSRQMELDFLLDAMLRAAGMARAALPDLHLLLALASPLFRDRVRAAIDAAGLPVRVVDGAREVMRASTVVLLASGTATVEAMVLGVPMVVAYRGAWFNWWIAHLAVRSRWAAIPNIMAGEEVVPERLQSQATPAALAGAVLDLLRDPSARQTMRTRLAALAAGLGAPGAARRAAAEILAAAGVALMGHSAIDYHGTGGGEEAPLG
jgi:lipid-A-disaccharide synthase